MIGTIENYVRRARAREYHVANVRGEWRETKKNHALAVSVAHEWKTWKMPIDGEDKDTVSVALVIPETVWANASALAELFKFFVGFDFDTDYAEFDVQNNMIITAESSF